MSEVCIDIGVKQCSVAEGGYFREQDRVLVWQLQDGETDMPRGEGWLLAVPSSDGRLRTVASGIEGRWFEAPRLIRTNDAVYVAVAGRHIGNGQVNADVIYRWTSNPKRPLIPVETEAWRRNVPLPPGLSINKGVVFTYNEQWITAETALWRSEDGDCCPTGGTARLYFDIRDDVLTLRDVERHTP